MTSNVTRAQMVTVCANLRQLLKKYNLTRLEAANQIGVTKAAMDNWLYCPGHTGMKGYNMDKGASFFKVPPEWLLSEHDGDSVDFAVRRHVPGRKPVSEMVQRMKDAESEYLARDETCKGCRYYGRLESGNGVRCCDYTFITGLIKHNPPASCEVKEIGPRLIRPDMYRAHKDAEIRRKTGQKETQTRREGGKTT